MSKKHWQTNLRKMIRTSARLVIVGVGNEWRGDDAAGLHVVRALRPHLAERADVLVLEAGLAPENCTGAIRVFAPDLVLFIDAADLGKPPGTIQCVSWQQITGLSASTHTLPLSLVATYLEAELGCVVGVVGIQAATTTWQPAQHLPPPMHDTVTLLVSEILASLDE